MLSADLTLYRLMALGDGLVVIVNELVVVYQCPSIESFLELWQGNQRPFRIVHPLMTGYAFFARWFCLDSRRRTGEMLIEGIRRVGLILEFAGLFRHGQLSLFS